VREGARQVLLERKVAGEGKQESSFSEEKEAKRLFSL
jgi:hypothetical protein